MREIKCVVCGKTYVAKLGKYCPECRIEAWRKKSIECSMRWQRENREKYREVNSRSRKNLYHKDEMFRKTQNMRSCFLRWMDTNMTGQLRQKSIEKFVEIIGMTPEQFHEEIKKKWTTRYNSRFHYNKKYIQLAHDTALHTAKTLDEMYALWHHTNLEYVIRVDNPHTGRPVEN
jgi:hypothetical protein